jgi:hypothetical protein
MILRKGSEAGGHMAVYQDLTILVEDAKIHGASVQVAATIKLVLLGVELHEVSSSPL